MRLAKEDRKNKSLRDPAYLQELIEEGDVPVPITFLLRPSMVAEIDRCLPRMGARSDVAREALDLYLSLKA